jgi:hypothetical protein
MVPLNMLEGSGQMRLVSLEDDIMRRVLEFYVPQQARDWWLDFPKVKHMNDLLQEEWEKRMGSMNRNVGIGIAYQYFTKSDKDLLDVVKDTFRKYLPPLAPSWRSRSG